MNNKLLKFNNQNRLLNDVTVQKETQTLLYSLQFTKTTLDRETLIMMGNDLKWKIKYNIQI